MRRVFTYHGGVSGFVASCSSSQDFLDELASEGATPDNARSQLYDDLICGLDSDGILAKLDRLFIYAAHNATASSVSLVNPTSAKHIEVNTPVFTADRGFKTNVGQTAYLNTQWSMSDGANNYASTDAMIGVYVRAWVDSNSARAFGRDNGANTGTKMNVRRITDSSINGQINNTTSSSKSISGSTGLILFDRTGTTESIIRNGTNETTLGLPGAVVIGGDMYVLGMNSGGTPSEIIDAGSEISAFVSGQHLTNGEHATLSTRIETYMDAVGAGVIP